MHFQAVIFDLDGTLLDTLADIADSVNSTLARFGLPTHRVDAYRQFIGDGITMLVSRALPAEKRNDDIVTDCVKVFRENYSRNWKVNTRPYHDVEELLDSLSAKHVKMAVLSNKPDDFTKRAIDELLPNHSFEMILGQRDGVPRKPDPAGALEIAEGLGIKPSRFLYLGDSAVDMETAVRAGMFPVGALWGFRPLEELWGHGAQALIHGPMELLGLLKKLRNYEFRNFRKSILQRQP
ncbi:MAG: HAD family hydrolase [Proteobacteria bacterium]|nr:HAD family hydrolase [Pseudomonadota bacterium]